MNTRPQPSRSSGGRHLLRDDDLSPADQAAVLQLAARLKADPLGRRPLDGRAVAVMFDKASTRTRVSFEVGIAELGAHPLIIDTSGSQLNRGEPIADTARVLDRQVAAVAWRTYAQSDLAELAAYSAVPVINALTDAFHPCQLLADLQTVVERLGDTQGRTVAYVGDAANNMAHSWLLAGATAGMHVRIAGPTGYHPEPQVVADAAAIAATTGGSIQVGTDPDAAVAGAHVVTTDTWVSMGQDGSEDRLAALAGFQVDAARMSAADPSAIFLHCLPAYRGKEVSAEVIDGARSAVWDEAENRRHAQKAVLLFLLGLAGDA